MDEHFVSDSPPGENSSDPMSEVFAPGTSAKYGQYVYSSPENDPEPPEEILYAFTEYGIGGQTYQCILKQGGGEAGTSNAAIIKTFKNFYPSTEWIKFNCGPGEYKLVFMWRKQSAPGVKNKKENFKSETIHISISDKCQNEYRDYQLKLRLDNYRKNRQMIRDLQMEKLLELQADELGIDEGGTALDPAQRKSDVNQAAQKQIEQSLQLARLMVPQAPALPQRSIEWDKILALAAPVVSGLLALMRDGAQKREEFTAQMITTMIGLSNNSNAQLVELVKAQQGPTKGQDMMKEFMDMIRSALDIKELFADKKESIADRLFSLVEGVAPHIAAILAMPRGQQMTDPRVTVARQFVQTSPDFEALKRDPREMIAFVNRLDEYYGWEQTDNILQIMTGGTLTRPEQCPRKPEQRYSAGDPRNEESEQYEMEGVKNEPGDTGEDSGEIGA